MAQVQEVSAKGLKREFIVTVPANDLDTKYAAALEERRKTANLKGFRPGKAPAEHVKKMYGTSIRAEMLDQAVSAATDQTLTERKLRPAMQPKIELVSMAEGKDLEFKLELEILPEVKIGDFSNLVLERPVAEVADKTIEDAITRAAKSTQEPVPVTETRPARMGDIAIIDFDGSVGGEAQPGMKSENHSLELGSKSFIGTFEEQIVGLQAGDKKTITVTFPADYHATALAGKEAEFKVTLHELRCPQPVTMDDELAKTLGFDTLAALRERVKADIGANYTATSRAVIKRHLMDRLAETYSFEVPASMLEAEFTNIWQQVQTAKTRGELPDADKAKSEDELKTEYRSIAERRIRLGLLLAEVAQAQKIEVAPPELRTALMTEARRFPGQEKAVIDYYTQTKGAIERLRAPLLEEKVVDYIIGQAKVTDKTVSAEDLLKMPAEMD